MTVALGTTVRTGRKITTGLLVAVLRLTSLPRPGELLGSQWGLVLGITLPGWQVRGWAAPRTSSGTAFDIVVVGGGLSGCAAAVAAAKRGARVLLLEPTHLLGGQMSTGGVGTADLAPGFTSTQEQGLWKEIARRVRTVYAGLGLTSAVARYRLNDSMGVNAPVVDRVLSEMCHAAGVEVVRNCTVSAATVTAKSATLETPVGTISAAVVVEATEDGALLELADLPYRIGTLTGKGIVIDGDPSATDIQRITQCAVIRRYDDGVPQALRMTTPPTDYEKYRNAIAENYPGKPWGTTTSDNDFAGYRAYPDIATMESYTALELTKITRTSLNWVNDTVVHADFLTDPAVRAAAITEAINRTLAVVYYLQVECDLPWAIALDEGFAEGPAPRSQGVTKDMPDWVVHLPVQPYIRESRRLIGNYTLTGRRIKRPNADRPCAWSAQNLAVGTYFTDMHGSDGPEDFESYLGETKSDKNAYRGPFVVPFGAFVPADGTRLVAAEKNLSMTRIASSAVRVHASVVAVGEASGVIAALAWKQRVSPKSVSYRAVQVSLLRGGALLLPYPIDRVPYGHPDYAAVSLALLHGRVPYHLDAPAHLIRLTDTRLASAKVVGRQLVAAWEGPL